MPLPLLLTTVLVLALLPLRASAQGAVVDRIVAVVDGRIITLDEWQQRERFEALMDGRKATEVWPSESSLNRLIDNILITKNAASVSFTPATPEEVEQQLVAVRKQLDASTPQKWQNLLASYKLSEDEAKAQLTQQLNTLRFVDARFRPGARITPDQVSAYYRDTFAPNFQKQAPAARPPALPDVTQQITSILIEQLIDQRFATWLQNLRTQARVQRVGPPTPTTAATSGPLR
jgi:hypothetical protein